ncbi:hypothetical protein L0F63_003714 [Massospora cicadina]|nr:hypothetical protein L0F63_003714 [Massospora cicadina]
MCCQAYQISLKGGHLVPRHRRFKSEMVKAPNIANPFGSEMAKPLRTFFNIVMTFLLFPSLSSPELYISIARRYQTYVQTLKKVPQLERPINNTENIVRLFLKAERAYFDNVNSFIGLFTESLFNATPRSNLLRGAILSCGLLWCTKTPLAKEAQVYLTNYLMQATTPSQLPLTLDTIQSLLILMLSMFGNSWITCRMDLFITIAMRAAYAIGLHIPRRTKTRVELERRLASNCLFYYLTFSLPPITLSTCILQRSSYFLFPTSEIALLFSGQLSVFNSIFPDIVSLKFSLVENAGPTSTAEIECRIKVLESRLTKICLDFMVKLNRLKLSLGPSAPQFDAMITMFSFYHAYYAFIISSLRMYRTTTSLRPVSFSPPSPGYVSTAIAQCARAISWALKVEKPLVHLYFVAKLSQLLIYLSHNHRHASAHQLELMNSGILYLRALQSSPYSGFINFRLFFLDTLSSLLPND